MTQIMQRPLSGRLGICTLDGDGFKPCGYHQDRAHSIAFGLMEDVLDLKSGEQTGYLVPGRDLKNMAGLFLSGVGPAGSWYLVREQREWLAERLYEILSSRRGHETVRILVAGVASYVHHYTCVAILCSVLGRLPDPPRIALVVVDRCLYPLLQIAAVERDLAAGLRKPHSIKVIDQTIRIDHRFFEVMTPAFRNFGRISTELAVRDLEILEGMTPLGQFDVITEHFLTAVLYHELEPIQRIRRVYSRILVPGGHLLCATGITRLSPSYQGYEDLHPELGLRKVEAKTVNVWDPFGLSKEEVLQLSLGKKASRVPCAIDNSMAIYRKE